MYDSSGDTDQQIVSEVTALEMELFKLQVQADSLRLLVLERELRERDKADKNAIRTQPD